MRLLEYYYQKLYPVNSFVEVYRIQKLYYDLVFYYESKKESTRSAFEDINNSTVDDKLNDFDAFVKS